LDIQRISKLEEDFSRSEAQQDFSRKISQLERILEGEKAWQNGTRLVLTGLVLAFCGGFLFLINQLYDLRSEFNSRIDNVYAIYSATNKIQ